MHKNVKFMGMHAHINIVEKRYEQEISSKDEK